MSAGIHADVVRRPFLPDVEPCMGVALRARTPGRAVAVDVPRPCRLVVPQPLREIVEEAWQHVDVFRRQCRELADARAVVVLSLRTRFGRGSQADTAIGVGDAGVVVATVSVPLDEPDGRAHRARARTRRGARRRRRSASRVTTPWLSRLADLRRLRDPACDRSRPERVVRFAKQRRCVEPPALKLDLCLDWRRSTRAEGECVMREGSLGSPIPPPRTRTTSSARAASTRRSS